jgi:hypothetical protein
MVHKPSSKSPAAEEHCAWTLPTLPVTLPQQESFDFLEAKDLKASMARDY